MNKKQIQRTSKKLETMIRQYLFNVQKPIMVKQQFRKLFTDILLDAKEKNYAIKIYNEDADKLLRDMVNS
jgi:hypothetical protein